MKAASRISRSASTRTPLYVLLTLIFCSLLGFGIVRGEFRAFLPAAAANPLRSDPLNTQKQTSRSAGQEPASGIFSAKPSEGSDSSASEYTGLITHGSSAQERQERPAQPASEFREFIRKNRTVIVISLAAIGIALTVADTLYVARIRRGE